MVAVALTDSEVAVIVAEPFATAVTSPVDDTVATAASDVAHVTVALLIAAPFWSLTVADSWDVAPSEARLRLVTERVIEVATGALAWTRLAYCLPHNSTTTVETPRHPTHLFSSCPHSALPHSGPQLRTRKTVLDRRRTHL